MFHYHPILKNFKYNYQKNNFQKISKDYFFQVDFNLLAFGFIDIAFL